MPPRPLAITMGDPAGIGPEIIVKAAARLRPRIEAGQLRLVVIGSNPALEQARAQFTPDIAIPAITEQDADWPPLCALQAGPEGEPIRPGQLSADGGRFAYLAVERGVRLAQSGRVAGIVTAPLNKEALNKAGYHYPGHTEMLAELTGVTGSCMMLAARQHTRESPNHAYRAGGCAEARHLRAAAPGHRINGPGAQTAW